MTVDRPDIVEAELLEQRAAGQNPAGIFLGALGGTFEAEREALGHPRRQVAQVEEGAAAHQPAQIRAHRADRRGDRHVVVVEDDQQTRLHRAGIVHRLVGHAGAHRAIADHGDHMAILLAEQVMRHRHAEAGGDAGAAMGGTERVVFAFRAPGEAREAAGLAKRPDPVASAGQDLVRIGLVPDVPDQTIAGGVEYRVQCDGEFDHAQRGAEMAARGADGIDRLGPQLVCDRAELVAREILQVTWIVTRSRVAVAGRGGSGILAFITSFRLPPRSKAVAPDAWRCRR